MVTVHTVFVLSVSGDLVVVSAGNDCGGVVDGAVDCVDIRMCCRPIASIAVMPLMGGGYCCAVATTQDRMGL